MADYTTITSVRTTVADPASLLAALRALDTTIGYYITGAVTYQLKTSNTFTAPLIASCQSTIDTAPASTPELSAQTMIDAMPIATKALLLTLLDQINTIRAALPTPLSAITPAQALAAVRAKAATL